MSFVDIFNLPIAATKYGNTFKHDYDLWLLIMVSHNMRLKMTVGLLIELVGRYGTKCCSRSIDDNVKLWL